MFKRSSANYSLWPEQARPRRGMSLTFAAGGFAVGIVCAIAVVNVASQYIRPMAMEPEPIQNAEAVRPIPVYSGASALVTGKAPASDDEPSATHSRQRTVAKVALPTIGRAVPVETDGRGDSSVKMPPVRLTDDSGNQAATVNADPKLIKAGTPEEKPSSPEQTKLASREPAPEAAAEPTPAEPAAAPVQAVKPEPRVRSRAQKRAERSRSRSASSSNSYWESRGYAREQRQRSYGQSSNRVVRFREAPVYGSNGAPINSYLPY